MQENAHIMSCFIICIALAFISLVFITEPWEIDESDDEEPAPAKDDSQDPAVPAWGPVTFNIW